MTLIAIAFVAGFFSVLTPCVLPLLPSILAFSSGEGRRRVWGLVLGIEISFIGLTLLLAGVVRALGLGDDALRLLAAVVLVTFGLVLIVPALERRFQSLASRLVSRIPTRQPGAGGDGFIGGLLGGLTLGLVWAPCAGPIFASIAVASSTDSFNVRTVGMALAFGAGMFLPLLGVAFGGRSVGNRLKRVLGGGRRVLAPMGVLVLLTGVAIGTGRFDKINEAIAERVNLTSTVSAKVEDSALKRDAQKRVAARVGGGGSELDRAALEEAGYPASDDGRLHDLGRAPDFTDVGKWYNTEGGKALDLKGLRGKVVLIDFWTYSCINCIRTLPYLRSWHKQYEDDGLVIIGVHAPEFEFEKRESNVAAAIEEFGLEYAVATDPDFGTWRRYYNHYWPAKYLIDREGQLRYVHYGEGEYDTTEERIRDLLGDRAESNVQAGAADCAAGQGPSGSAATDDCVETAVGAPTRVSTPETYLGYERIAAEQYAGRLVSGGGVRPDLPSPDVEAAYTAPSATASNAGLTPNQYAFTGRWTVQGERSTAGAGAELLMHYGARRVFLVIGVPGGGTAKVQVDDSGSKRTIQAKGQRLYTLRDSESFNEGLLRIAVPPGVEVYAFTFG